MKQSPGLIIRHSAVRFHDVAAELRNKQPLQVRESPSLRVETGGLTDSRFDIADSRIPTSDSEMRSNGGKTHRFCPPVNIEDNHTISMSE